MVEYAKDEKDKDFLAKMTASTTEGKVLLYCMATCIFSWKLSVWITIIMTYNYNLTTCNFRDISTKNKPVV